MKKIVVFVLGHDKPGIIAAVTKTLFDQRCNLEDVSQTILQTEFIGIFIASLNEGVSEEAVSAALRKTIEAMGLFVHVRSLKEGTIVSSVASEPFVITTIGPDKPGLMAGVTEILARHKVNITNLKAVFKGDNKHHDYVMIFEVDVPSSMDMHVLRSDLYGRAKELGLDLSLQHREIFEELNRV